MSTQASLTFLGQQLGEPELSESGAYAQLPPELWRIVEQFSTVEFPIDCKRELVEKLGANTQVDIGAAVDIRTLAMFIPAHYFPISSVDNLAEKLSDFYFQRREIPPKVMAPKADELKRQLDALFEENPRLIEAAAELVFRFLDQRSN